MHIHLRERDGDARGVQCPLSLVQQTEIHVPVVLRLHPHPHSEIQTAIRALEQHSLRRGIRQDALLAGNKFVQHPVNRIQIAAVVHGKGHVQPPGSLP